MRRTKIVVFIVRDRDRLQNVYTHTYTHTHNTGIDTNIYTHTGTDARTHTHTRAHTHKKVQRCEDQEEEGDEEHQDRSLHRATTCARIVISQNLSPDTRMRKKVIFYLLADIPLNLIQIFSNLSI